MNIKHIHHVAIICSDYERSKQFYTQVLGFTIKLEHYRAERKSYKLDLCINDQYQIELFSFPNSAERANYPEARGLRHLAFAVENIDAAIAELLENGVESEQVRIDELTGKRYTFFKDPDGLPLELYEDGAQNGQ